jgi:hypothetical protein
VFEKYMIVTRGFRNIRQEGEVVGFQFNLRTTYYRGVFLCIISELNVEADGEAFSPEQLRVSFGGKEFTLAEMAHEESARWPFGEPALVSVMRKGGLKPGRHELSVTQVIKPAYIPGRGFVAHARKKITLVQ